MQMNEIKHNKNFWVLVEREQTGESHATSARAFLTVMQCMPPIGLLASWRVQPQPPTMPFFFFFLGGGPLTNVAAKVASGAADAYKKRLECREKATVDQKVAQGERKRINRKFSQPWR